jgi:hypothetical protein
VGQKTRKKTVWKQVILELISVSKITWLICSPGFVKYFPEAVTDKYKWITDPFHADFPQNYDFSLEEGNYIDIISDTPLKVWFPRKSYIEFWVGIGAEVPHLSRKVVNNLLPFATFYLCKTGFSAVAANKTKYHSMSDHF